MKYVPLSVLEMSAELPPDTSMQRGGGALPDTDQEAAIELAACPCCGGHIKRVRRSLLDRLISIFSPVFRWRCCSVACQWEGILRNAGGATKYRYHLISSPMSGEKPFRKLP